MKKALNTLALICASSLTLLAQSYVGYLAENLEIRDSLNKQTIRKARKGDGVLVYTLDVYEGNRYKVHHINSGKDGFVQRKEILLESSVPYTANSIDEIKQAIKDTEMRDPKLNFTNSTKNSLKVKFGKEEFSLSPNETKSMKMSKGKYYYKLMVPGYDPYYGVEHLENHRKYDWDFYVGK